MFALSIKPTHHGNSKKTLVKVESTINVPAEKVWQYWSAPEHITLWCQASDDWRAILDSFKNYVEANS